MTLRLASPLPILAAMLAGCTTTTSTLAERCTIEVEAVEPAAAEPGDHVVLRARPLTTSFDTAIYLDGARAAVLDLSRDGCDACDTCRSENGCNVCGDCDACDAECRADCSETVTFAVPDMAAGETELRIYNSHGTGGPVPFTVEGGPADTGGTDSGAGDTASSDTAASDTAASDTASGDTAAAPPR